MKNTIKLISQAALVLSLVSCSHKKIVSEERDVKSSENPLTGNRTVTEDTEIKYQDQRSGQVTTKNKVKKTKYDKKGRKISESTEVEQQEEAR